MACNLAGGIQIGCRDNVGGLLTMWITDYTNIQSVTSDTGSTVTAISGTGTFYEFQLIRQTASLTETVNASLENETSVSLTKIEILTIIVLNNNSQLSS